MLGMGRASQYAGWWNTGGAIKITIPVATSVSQAAYQTPAFSWLTGGTYPNYGVWSDPSQGSINVSGYNSLTGYNSLRCTMARTFQLPWSSGLSTNTYYGGPIYRIGYPGPNSPYEFTIEAYIDSSNRLTFTAGSTNGSGGPGIGPTTYLPGTYTDYASTWFTAVYSQAETSSAYTNWSGTGSGTVYCRLAVYNAQTGALLLKIDIQTAAGNWPDITSIITGSGGSVAFDQSSTYALGFRTNAGGQEQITTYAQNWISLGTMWDPLTAKAAGDTTWLTTRPNNTIGTGKAWVNHQWTNYENVSNNWWLTDTADDLVTGTTNNRQARIVVTGNTTVFNNSYSTSIPKDTS